MNDDDIAVLRDDLKLQARMFDMDIDWETFNLVPQRTDVEPQWLKSYRERQADSDKQYDHITQGMDGKDE